MGCILSVLFAVSLASPRIFRAALLNHVRELMGDQLTAVRLVGRELARAEHDVLAYGIGDRVYGLRRSVRLGVGVYANRREVMAESGLEKVARGEIERTSGRLHDIMDDRRRVPDGVDACFSRLGLHEPIFLRRAFPADPQPRWRHGWCGSRHAHHLVGDPVRLMFKRIVNLPNSELCLYDAWERRCCEPG
jgi:hypothetical protein